MKREADFYRPLAAWAKRYLQCFETKVEVSVRHGRIDVVGLRDRGGRLSGRAEVIALEVKRSSAAFAASVGQAAGYSIYADRCYLAVWAPEGFTQDQVAIASRLGVGLIRISGENRLRFTEILSAPLRDPLDGLRLEAIEKLDYSQCTICGSFFLRGMARKWDAFVERQDEARPGHMERAVARVNGVVYWLGEPSDRSKDDARDPDVIHHRRYLCADCVYGIFDHVVYPVSPPGVGGDGTK